MGGWGGGGVGGWGGVQLPWTAYRPYAHRIRGGQNVVAQYPRATRKYHWATQVGTLVAQWTTVFIWYDDRVLQLYHQVIGSTTILGTMVAQWVTY